MHQPESRLGSFDHLLQHQVVGQMGNFFGGGPVVSLPIFTGGRICSQVRVQDARLKETVITYRSAVLSALEETENALVAA